VCHAQVAHRLCTRLGLSSAYPHVEVTYRQQKINKLVDKVRQPAESNGLFLYIDDCIRSGVQYASPLALSTVIQPPIPMVFTPCWTPTHSLTKRPVCCVVVQGRWRFAHAAITTPDSNISPVHMYVPQSIYAPSNLQRIPYMYVPSI
jgi:hypothetical protein